jgi:hypothetical protein
LKYKDKFGHTVEAAFNVKSENVIVVYEGIYERQYTYKEWQVQREELYELESRTTITRDGNGVSSENKEKGEQLIAESDRVPDWLLRKKMRIVTTITATMAFLFLQNLLCMC